MSVLGSWQKGILFKPWKQVDGVQMSLTAPEQRQLNKVLMFIEADLLRLTVHSMFFE